MKKMEDSYSFKELRETDTYKEWKEEMKESSKSYDTFKGNVKQKIDTTDNVVFSKVSDFQY